MTRDPEILGNMLVFVVVYVRDFVRVQCQNITRVTKVGRAWYYTATTATFSPAENMIKNEAEKGGCLSNQPFSQLADPFTMDKTGAAVVLEDESHAERTSTWA